MPTPLIEWTASVNNILFANGHAGTVEQSKIDIQISHGLGYSPLEIAYKILGKELPPPTLEPRWTLQFLIDNEETHVPS